MRSAKKKILVVDDDPDILFSLQILLEDVGYAVETTCKDDFVSYPPHDDAPDLILLDLLLSGSDGREITRQLKSRAHTKHIPIIMLSAHPNAEQIARTAGADDFLAKPFDMDELLDKIVKCTRHTL